MKVYQYYAAFKDGKSFQSCLKWGVALALGYKALSSWLLAQHNIATVSRAESI